MIADLFIYDNMNQAMLRPLVMKIRAQAKKGSQGALCVTGLYLSLYPKNYNQCNFKVSAALPVSLF